MFSTHTDANASAEFAEPKNIDIIAIGADGCIFNEWYFTHKACLGNPIAANMHLIERWVQQIKKNNPDFVVFTMFDRHAVKDDYAGTLRAHSKTGVKSTSFYPVMLLLFNETVRLLAKENIHIPCELDRLLLSDIFAGIESGTAFELALACLRGKWVINHPMTIPDESKLLICYLQTQRYAAYFPEAKIRYSAYDNSGFTPQKDKVCVLHTLTNFLSTKSASILIPQSVTLELCEYAGKSVKTLQINGKGKIDFQYKATILEMTRLAGINTQDIREYGIKHNICAAFSGETNAARLKQLNQFIAEKNCYAHNQSLATFKPARLTTINEMTETEDEIKVELKRTSSPPSS